jgi:tRNA pseudouridine38-40 synthase
MCSGVGGIASPRFVEAGVVNLARVERRFYAVLVSYDGGRFRGFQRQPGLPTVQGALEDALLAAGVRARLAVAARTDAGVHALAQMVSFSTRAALDPDALRRALNAALPEGIAVLSVHDAGRAFHARADALSRTYVYLVGAPAPECARGYAWSLPDERAFPELAAPSIDPETLRRCLAAAVGTHDFRGFARPGEQRGTVRALTSAEIISAEWAPLHAIVLEGRGFLRAMVRNLVGTAVTAAVGRGSPDAIRELLAAGGRYRGVRAPGWGLTLARVTYPPGKPGPEAGGGR